MLRRWTDDDLQTIDALHRENVPWNEIASRMKVTPDAVRGAWRRWQESSRVEESPFVGVEWPEDPDWREFCEVWQETTKLHKRFDPVREDLTIDLSKIKEPIAIACAADLHMGGGWTNHATLQSTIEFILNTPRMFVGFVGDTIEGFIPGQKSAEPAEQQVSSVKAQLSAIRSLANEMASANKALWWSWGDHDAKWFEQLIGTNVVKLAIHDRIPYFDARGLVHLYVGSEEYYILVNHSERFTSQWNPVHPARRAYEQVFPADVVVTAHRHKPAFSLFHHYDQLREAGLNLGGESWLVQCGTFKTGPDTYTVRTWTKGVIGVPTLVFDPATHDVHCFKSPLVAARYL